MTSPANAEARFIDVQDRPELSVESVTVAFGGLRALTEVRFSVAARRSTGVIGPNGAGKSTLLNVLSGLVTPQSGSVRLRGQQLVGRPAHLRARLGIGRTFQGLDVSPQETVLDNVMVGGVASTPYPYLSSLLGGIGGRGAERRLRESAGHYLDLLSIGSWAARRMSEVPYAVQKRAQIARALMPAPSVLLLDEPASGMSTQEKAGLARVLRQIRGELHLTMVVIEHDVGFLLGLCDELVAMTFGRVLMSGAAADVVADERVIEAYLGKVGADGASA